MALCDLSIRSASSWRPPSGASIGSWIVSFIRPGRGSSEPRRKILYSAVNSYWHNGQAELDRECESSPAEGVHAAVEGARTFGKDNYRHAAGKALLGGLHRGADGRRARVVNEYVARYLAAIADKGYALEALLHHPPEVVAEIAVNREYIIRSLVVGYEDIALATGYFVAPVYGDAHQRQYAEQSAPYRPGVVAEDTASAKGAAYRW